MRGNKGAWDLEVKLPSVHSHWTGVVAQWMAPAFIVSGFVLSTSEGCRISQWHMNRTSRCVEVRLEPPPLFQRGWHIWTLLLRPCVRLTPVTPDEAFNNITYGFMLDSGMDDVWENWDIVPEGCLRSGEDATATCRSRRHISYVSLKPHVLPRGDPTGTAGANTVSRGQNPDTSGTKNLQKVSIMRQTGLMRKY